MKDTLTKENAVQRVPDRQWLWNHREIAAARAGEAIEWFDKRFDNCCEIKLVKEGSYDEERYLVFDRNTGMGRLAPGGGNDL